jgi:predicted  nucleic acid-binding Zn-ribbon protein
MNDAQKLMSLKSDLERHETLKNSSLAGINWKSKKAELEKEFFNLRIQLFEKQIEDLQTAKQRLEKDFREGKQLW